ncbi:uncharacterized protein METZ01_LOCUS464561, partial [marine metagenome]
VLPPWVDLVTSARPVAIPLVLALREIRSDPLRAVLT